MNTLALLVMHVLIMLAQRVGPGGAKAIMAESVFFKIQQLIVCRSDGKTPRLTTLVGRAYDLIRVIVEVPGHVRSHNSDRKRLIREKLRNLLAACLVIHHRQPATSRIFAVGIVSL